MGQLASMYRYCYLTMDDSTYSNSKKISHAKMVFALSECLYDRDLLLAENDAFLYFLPNGNCMLGRV